MAIKIKFDLSGNPEPPTIILATRSGKKLGQLDVDSKSIDLSDVFNDASEFTFTLNKFVDGELTNLWDKVVNFKLVWCKEWDMWFEITVEIDEETETVKTVFCKQLGQAELSQINLYNIEINTEADIERDDYKITILYDEKDSKASLLDRLLEKAPHYSIVHVDSTIANIQRSFSFDGTSIYDAFMEIAEEIGCLFVFHSNSDENGNIQRTISVYDLQQNCMNIDCGYRGEFTDACPKCGGTNIKNGYGDDTLIFVTADELASGGIQLTTDTDSIKNCFKLEAGDDLMTATIRNCNPNGTDYIWRFSDNIKDDMSEELVNKIESYDETYKSYYNDYESNIDSNMVTKYNALVDKYSIYNEDLKKIDTPIKGYSNLMNAYYNVIDLSLYLESALMPSIEMSKTSAEEQVKLLTASSLSPVAVNTEHIEAVSLATANSAVLSMAKIIVKSTYKVEVGTSTLSDDKIWRGNFIVTNYSDDEDTATSNTIEVIVNNDTETFIKQKIDKALNKENTDDYSVTGLFEKEYDDFCAELKKYALNPLKSFYDACDSCINILIDQGAGSKEEKPDLYESLYEPYYKKSSAISAEMKIREDEIAVVDGVWDKTDEESPKLITKGLKQCIEECKHEIQINLNFEEYLGNDLWLEFCSYRREDKYSNDNYISDGLNNAELFEKALEFIEVAENEIYKSSELQHSISTTLNNLLAIPKFKPLVESFSVGNWIRVRIDDNVYKLRLLKYDISFGDFDNIPVEFSDVTKIKNGITDVESILSQASSMATSYDSVQKQAKQGNDAQGTIDKWLTNGLNTALVQIQNNDSEDIIITKNGLLGRSYSDITETYSPEQIKLTHNIIAYTDDNWKSVRQAIGKHDYVLYDEGQGKFVDKTGYGVSANFLTAGVVSGSQIIGGDVYSDNYSVTDKTGSYLNLRDGTFSFGGGSLRYEGGKLLISSPDIPTTETITEINEEYIKTTSVYAENLQIGSANIKGTLTAEQIDATNLKVDAANITGTLTIGQLQDGTIPTSVSQLNNDVGYQTETGVVTIVNGTITADYIKTLNLEVGNQIKMGENAVISWNNITEQPTIPTKTSQLTNDSNYQNATQVTTITKDTISTTNVLAQNLRVNAAKIEGTLTANQIDATNLTVSGANVTGTLTAASISASKITAGTNSEAITFNGAFTAPSATITGNITATSGAIGGWNVYDGLLGSAFQKTVNNTTNWYGVALDARKAAFDAGYNIFAIGRFDITNGGSSAKDAIMGSWQNSAFKVNALGHVEANDINITGGSLRMETEYNSESGHYDYVDISSSGSMSIGMITSQDGVMGIRLRPSSIGVFSANSDTKMIGLAASTNTGWLYNTWYTSSNAVVTSDVNKKNTIEPQDELYSDIFDKLRPVTFKYNDGNSDRTHLGLIAQEVEDAVLSTGLTTKEFAPVCYNIDEYGNKVDYGIRYAELVSMCIHEIQKLKNRIALLESQ